MRVTKPDAGGVTPTAGRRSPRLLAKVLLGAFSVGFTLLLLDGAMRVAGIGTPRRGVIEPKPARHPLTSWIDVYPPGYTGGLASREFSVRLTMNSLGLRDREPALDAKATNGPCVFMGDSYFFGWGIETDQRLGELLSAQLGQAGVPVPAVNLAFPGWGTFHYVEMWKEFVPRLRPRLVIVSCFIGNDLSDDLKQVHRLEEGTGGSARQNPAGGGSYHLGLAIRDTLATSPILGAIQHLIWQNPALRGAFNQMEMRNDRLVLYEREPSRLQTQLFDGTLGAMTALARASRESGIPLIYVLIPDHLQVLSPELFRGLEMDQPQTRIRKHLEGLGIEYLDLLPAFRATEHPERYFFREDKHWTPEGHAFVAKLLLPLALRRLEAQHGIGALPTRAP